MRICLFLIGMVLALSANAAEESFLRGLRKEELQSTGIHRLTPEEKIQLEALVQRFKSGVVNQERLKTEAALQAAEKAAQVKVLAAEAKAKDEGEKAAIAEAKVAEEKATIEAAKAEKARLAAAEIASQKNQPSWFKALVTLNRAAESKAKAEPLNSRLVGEFSGWGGDTVFSLEDGTRWRQQNADERYVYTPSVKAPKVRVRPATFSGFWMEFEGISRSVRVVLMELPDKK